MRLVEVTVKNYRSIGSQTKFDVEDLTTLVGPNNEGKTNLLRALGLGMYLIERWSMIPPTLSAHGELTGIAAARVFRSSRPSPSSRRQENMGYSWLDDYPLAKQERPGTHPTVLRLKFRLNEEEVRDFFQATGIANNGELPVEMSLSRGSASFGVVKLDFQLSINLFTSFCPSNSINPLNNCSLALLLVIFCMLGINILFFLIKKYSFIHLSTTSL